MFVVFRPAVRVCKPMAATVLFAFTVACGGGSQDANAESVESSESPPAAAAEPQVASAESAPVDACTMVTVEDVNALLTQVGRATTAQMAYSPGAGYCQYPLADYGTLMIEPTIHEDVAAAQRGMEYSRSQNSRNTTVTAVAGIGDEALEFKSPSAEVWNVHARRGRLVIVAWSGKGAKGPELARGLAALAFSKYPEMP